MLEENGTRVLLVREKERNDIVGLGIGTIMDNEGMVPARFGKIDDVWIEENHRRKGLCRNVVRSLIEFFKEKDIEDVSLDHVVGDWEAEAIWKKMGFHPAISVANGKTREIEENIKE